MKNYLLKIRLLLSLVLIMVSFSRFLFASGLSQNEQTSTSIIPFDKFLGVNAFVNDPLDKMQCVGFIREYHNWNWDEGDIWDEGGNTNYPGYPNNEIKWAPSEAGGGAWNFDDFYTNTVNGGITVAPCLKETAKWLRPDFSIGLHDKPTDNAGASTTDPNSYQAKAHHMYQFAARYGSTAVPDDKLTLAPGQPRNTAMGLISYVEDWNEQDKNWEGAAAYFSPQEYAAMASANYDGHANTMTQGSGTFGVKNADPNMKFVMGGIWEINIDYIDAMKTWFAENRADGKFACDVINVHNYSWDGNGPALSPEAFDFEGKMKAVVDYRDQNLNPEIEVWISEFGWDTHPGSRLRPKVTAPFDIYEVQAQWLVRAYLAFAAAGVDRAQQYMLRDVNPESSTQFSTSGMITRYGEWNPKTSWYYVYTLKNTLTNMRFAGKSTTGNENVYAYEFKDIDADNGAYVVWCPTSNNTKVDNFNLNIGTGSVSATLVEMAPGSTTGTHTSLTITDGYVTVNVSERPLFVLVDQMEIVEDTTPPASINNLNASGITFNSLTLNWTAPGNDGNTGTAAAYDIRYSTSEITPENFANATQVTGVPAPQEAGSAETFTVSGLELETTYYFAIKTRDGSSNVSDISNVLNVTTAQFIPGGEAEWLNLTSNILSYIQGNEHIYLGSLVDEQGLFVTEPEDDKAAPSPLTYWNPSWGTVPVFQLDLGDLYSIDKIAIHDYWGTQNLTVSYWANNQWNELFTWGLTYSDRWRVVDVDVITNSLKFEYAGTGGQIGEIGIKAASSAVDEIAPADIADLSTSNVTSNAVTLNWTAPGNDGNEGIAAAYDIRYSTSEITEGNFANATQVTGVPAPQEAGSAETFTVSGLNAATAYYFAIKTADEALNVSDLSTIVSATTPSEPIQSDPYWIPLTKTMFSYHSGNTMISLDSLSDEQHVFVVDPINGQSSPVIENYTDPAWGEPPVFDLDLGRNYAIDKIALFDHWGSAGLTIKYFAVSRWVTLTTWDMSYSERWKVFETSIVTSRLRFEFDGIGAKVGEIGIKGVEDDTPQAPDNIAPSAVTDLTATSISSVSVKLDWTAPGNDDIDGMAAGYDIRYSTEPINAANFENATVVDNSSKPKAFGSLETVTVNNLNPSTIYYFAIKAFDEVMNTSDISNIANVQTHGADFVSRIEITDDMVINEYGWSDNRGSFANLFDEQSHLIEDDPVNIPATHWRVPSVALTDTVGIVIDLGREYEIDRFFWFDGAEMGYNGTDNEIKGGKLIVQTGTPFDWDIQVNEELDNDNVWHSFVTPITTRFIRIVKLSTQTYMWTTQSGFNADAPLMEMVFYGTPTGDLVPPIVQPPHVPLNLTFDQQVGANAWWYTNTNIYDAVGIVRAYQDWSQSASATETSTCNFKPEFDTQYASTLEGNFEVFPCLQGGIVQGSHNKPPYSADGNTRNPASYALHADHVFQWVARYGHNTSIDPALLRPVEWQRKSPGLGYINYFENWNEQDRWWSGDSAYFNAYQYSAMTSADYDGHMGTMGATYGSKNADPSVKFAMGGTISIEHEFVKAMKFWADHNRGGDFPADVLNFHLYSNDGGGQDAGATMGISPEADHLDEKLRDLVIWCNTNLPGKEVWVSEFGYDVEGDSWQIAKGHTLFGEPGYTAVDLQASWLVRSYIVGVAAGVDRMMVYSIKDASASKRQFATCGLIDFNNNKRPSWYYVKTMKDRLAGMIFEGKKESGNSNVWIYKFRTKGKKTGAYVVWCPTSNGTSVENYTLNFDAVTSTAKLVSLANLEPAGIESNLTVDNNSSVFNVSENPVFILVDNIDDNIVADVTAPSAIDDLSATEITSVSVKLNWSATGNDGAEGRAEGYDIRYSTSEITSENFEQATVVENDMVPLAYGFAESFVVEGLDANTTYYFAIKAFDEESNYAEISNVIEVTTHITPLYISEWLILDNSMLNLVSGSTGMSMNTLVDEQGIFSTEPSDNVEAPLPTSIYDPSWGDPQTIILNLGADYYLDKIAIFDGWGSSGLNVTYYNGEEWVALFSWALTYGNRWKVVDLNIVAGQLKFEFTTTGGKVGEIGLKGYDITTVENRIPVANAGLNQVVNEGVMVSLDGIASSDPDSDEITFLWTAPEGIILNANDVAQPTFTAPQVDQDSQYEFTLVVNDGELDSEPSTVMVTVVNLIPSRPVMHLVSELIIANGEADCIDAYNTITIAGDGGTVVIEDGASANIVAGKSIRFLPGFHAQAGSQVSAYITTDNSFCDMLPQALVAVNPIVEKSVDSDNTLIEPINAFDEKQVKVYPNPNNGVFTIELTNFDRRTEIIIVNMLGKVVHRVENAENNQMGISIPFIQKGIYSIVVSDGHTLETRKMVIH